jgi:hypothetical protein
MPNIHLHTKVSVKAADRFFFSSFWGENGKNHDFGDFHTGKELTSNSIPWIKTSFPFQV